MLGGVFQIAFGALRLGRYINLVPITVTDQQVEQIRASRAFDTYRVTASQEGTPIFEMLASHHLDEPGPEHQIPMDDDATYALLQSGETTNVFQLESSGMQSLFKQLRPDRFDDIVAAGYAMVVLELVKIYL